MAAAVAVLMAARAGRAGDLASPGCLAGGEPGTVASIDAELEPVLDDGRHLLLPGLALPQEEPWAGTARAALAGWLTGHTVLVRPLSGDQDRWGRWPAFLFADVQPTASDATNRQVSVAEALIDAGLARARPDARTGSCWSTLRELERGARAARRGLWSDPRFAVIAADDAKRLGEMVGSFALVEGRIFDVAEGRSRIYLHLTAAGRHGFAVAVERRNAAALKAAGLDLAAASGRSIRVRGLLDNRFGPQIELTSADQIEFTGAM